MLLRLIISISDVVLISVQAQTAVEDLQINFLLSLHIFVRFEIIYNVDGLLRIYKTGPVDENGILWFELRQDHVVLI